MAHELEFVSGEASMAYAYKSEVDVPWHGLGTKVSNDLTPQQMLEAAKLDWGVYTEPCYADLDGKKVELNKQVLVRDRDHKVLDVISNDWKPLQNIDAFEFFNDFVAAGHMNMDTAGSLKGGRRVWALAKIDESFALFNGKDQVDSYLLFSNPHQYGSSIDVRMTAVRVVCNNTLTLSLNQKSKNFVKINHRRQFDPEQVKEALGISKDKLEKYKEMGEFLSSKRYTDENVVDYFKRIFPVADTSEKDMSRNAYACIETYMNNMPGAELGEGSFWQLYNTITYFTSHVAGRSDDNRVSSLWYGNGKNLNAKALEVAVEMAG